MAPKRLRTARHAVARQSLALLKVKRCIAVQFIQCIFFGEILLSNSFVLVCINDIQHHTTTIHQRNNIDIASSTVENPAHCDFAALRDMLIRYATHAIIAANDCLYVVHRKMMTCTCACCHSSLCGLEHTCMT